MWLVTRTGKMELSCPLGTTRRATQEKFPLKPYNKSFIDQICPVKMAVLVYFWRDLWTSTPSRSINTQKKNLSNVQPSWPIRKSDGIRRNLPIMRPEVFSEGTFRNNRWAVQSPIKPSISDYFDLSFNFSMRFSVYAVCPSVLSLTKFKLRKT